jgi:hypothetical protein
MFTMYFVCWTVEKKIYAYGVLHGKAKSTSWYMAVECNDIGKEIKLCK